MRALKKQAIESPLAFANLKDWAYKMVRLMQLLGFFTLGLIPCHLVPLVFQFFEF